MKIKGTGSSDLMYGFLLCLFE